MLDRLHIPGAEFQTRTETEKLSLIIQRLGDVGLDGTSVLFCGVEGHPLLERPPEDRRMTFAVSFKKFAAAAREVDETGSTYDGGYPLEYATRLDVSTPAIAVYDRSQMIPEHPEEDEDWDWLEEWIHKDNNSVNDALKAIVFIDR